MTATQSTTSVLDLTQVVVSRLSSEIEALTPEQWERQSNCTGWKVGDLAAHVVRNGESILLAVQRAVSGDPTPVFGPMALQRQKEIVALGPGGCADQQRRQHQELAAFVAGLDDEQLARTFPHPLGPRSVTWFVQQRLAEVAFHEWDLHASLAPEGRDRPLDETIARRLLPFLLDTEHPVVRGHVKTAGEEHVFYIVSTADRSVWRVAARSTGLAVERSASAQSGAVAVEGDPGWLCLAVYGRVTARPPHLTVSGPADAVDRFAAVFGPE